MKVTKETKFDIDQNVFFVEFGNIYEGVVRSIQLSSYISDCEPFYTVRKDLGSTYSVNEVKKPERYLYATFNEAFVEALNQRNKSLNNAIIRAKQEICRVSKVWKVAECQTEEQKDALRLLRKTNEALAKLIKKGSIK